MKMKAILTAIAILIGAIPSAAAENPRDLQTLAIDLAPTASASILPISVWFDAPAPGQQGTLPNSVVVGTGFLVNQIGDFVTAAHVLNLAELKKNTQISNVRLTATIRQKDGSGMGSAFSIVAIDEDHDLALCHIPNFKTFTPEKDVITTKSGHPDAAHPFASLAISEAAPKVGQFVFVSGFPLGSWSPSVQLGLISAIEEIGASPIHGWGTKKDRRELLQISVSANHGNSGGPVINIASGEVVGVILQIVPAPLQIQGQQILDPGSFSNSGLMFAAPASWIRMLFKDNNVVSQGTKVGKLVIW
jgi:S1-C subfamily serine protease